MFEFDQSNVSASVAGQTLRPTEKISYENRIVDRSFLLWSEHCIECAAPECYQSCDLFKVRPDERCRRFDYGTRRNRAFKGAAGPSAEIVFSQWGKLEARGNTVLFARRWLNAAECILYALAPLSNLVGNIARRFGGSLQWSSLTFELLEMLSRSLHKRSRTAKPPNAFLIEIYNPGKQKCYLKFECAVFRSRLPKRGASPLPFWERLSLAPGYNRIILDYASFEDLIDSGLPYKLSLTPEAVAGTHLIFICLDFVRLSDYTGRQKNPVERIPKKIPEIPVAIADFRVAAKCVIFDLDNTLWSGVLTEGEVTLKTGVKALFEELDRRGILISVASKNNEADALAKLQFFGLSDFIVYPLINWSQKSANIKLLARKISIATDTLIFVDDSPFEREEVERAISDIEVLPETAIDSLLKHSRLAGSQTTESANRRAMYKQQIEREAVQVEFGEDYLAFLKKCEIVVSIIPSQEQHRERIIELLQRTNQLNFSGTKYTRNDVSALLADETTDKHIILCSDKYGDYGVVGFSITQTRGNVLIVKDFMLSCRVQGKLIEKAFFNFLATHSIEQVSVLNVNFVSTPRNTLARQVLQEIGFDMDAGKLATIQLRPGVLSVDFLQVN